MRSVERGISVLALVFIAALCCSADLSAYPNNQTLAQGYNVYWRTDSTMIYLGLQVQTMGWIGLGLGEVTSGSMPGSDMVIIEPNGSSFTVTDRYATEFATPDIDDCTQDWVFVSGQQVNGTTTVEIKRLLQTNDNQDRAIIPGLTRVVYAWGGNNAKTIQYHGSSRGSTTVPFIPSNKLPALPSTVRSYSVQMPNVSVPSTVTNYLCASFELPYNPVADAHIIRIDPLIEPDNVDIAHHMLVFVCNVPSQSYLDFKKTPGTNCLSTGFAFGCSSLMYMWAAGAGPLVLPEQAGFRLGQNSTRYVIVQMHYNNAKRQSGRRDNSGFKIYYDYNLRQYDAGVLQTGDMLLSQPPVPAGNPAYAIEMTCPSACTSKFDWDIQVFAEALHMHNIGSKIWSTLWRPDSSGNVSFVQQNAGAEFYQFDFQQGAEVNYTLKRGDTFNLHCVYDSSNQKSATDFGESSSQEMCMDFLFYYPKLPRIAGCVYLEGGQYTGCGDFAGNDWLSQILFVENPSRRDPTDLVRNGELFGKSCKDEAAQGSGTSQLRSFLSWL
eukprot:TRINITY_DN25723_c0_g1_i1.p1 TRINITY_DN25723_c0_g1~~TRINITY_DN25723_c0_g1_i1.p1  ORF type:complete len:550 (+),score=106.64 TRINITY_DN25723_c0_g1_i1:65-1714(+)